MRPHLVAALAGLIIAGERGSAWASETTLVAVPANPARRVYAYQDGAVYPVLASPGRITDLMLEPGERLASEGALAAGDTARWIIGDTTSGAGQDQRVHVFVKPSAQGLATNLIISTTRRTYHLDLRAVARGAYPEVRWRYAQIPVVLAAAPPAPASTITAEADPVRLNLAYRIKGPRVAWRPVRAFDDGRRSYVEFGPAARLADLPPLFLTGADGKSAVLVNYRVVGRRIVVDRIFDHAELRLGQGRAARRIRIIREASQ